MIKKTVRKYHMIFVLCGAFFLRIINLNQSLWLDEAASAISAVQPVAKIINTIDKDFMPPLFYILLHYWIGLAGKTEWAMRILPVFFSLLSIYLTYRIGTVFYSKKIGLLTAFLMSVSPFFLFYSQELRPYSLMVFLVLLTTYLLIKKTFIAYAACLVFLPFTVYTAMFVIPAHAIMIWLYDRKNLKTWLVSCLPVIMAFLWWLQHFIAQIQTSESLASGLPAWKTIASSNTGTIIPLIFAKFFLGRITLDNKSLYALIVVFLILAWLILFKHARAVHATSTGKAGILFFIPLCVGLIISIISPVLAPQRLLYLLPFFLLVASAGLYNIKNTPQKILFWLVMVVPTFYGLYQYESNPRFQREQWREAVHYVMQEKQPFDQVWFAFPEIFAPYAWYRTDSSGIALARSFMLSKVDPQQQTVIPGTRIIYFTYLADITDPEKVMPDYFEANRYRLVGQRFFSGLGDILIFEKN